MPAALQITAYELGQRYIGIEERAGSLANHPLISWWHSLCGGEQPDEVPWCSSFINGMAWELRLPRSRSKAARSWLSVGTPIALDDAESGFDVAVLKRGSGVQPGPDELSAPGHVGFFAFEELDDDAHGGRWVWILGGNQANSVSLARFPVDQVLGVRRLAW